MRDALVWFGFFFLSPAKSDEEIESQAFYCF